MVACMAVLLAGYVILTWPKKVESGSYRDCGICGKRRCGDIWRVRGTYSRSAVCRGTCACGRVFGEYAFRRRNICHQEPGTFVINQDQYRAKADKARAQLKKDEAQALKAKRDLERIRPLCAERCQPAGFGQCPGCLRDCRSLSSDEPGRFGPG